MIEKKFKLDRTAFKMQTFEEADNQVEYWQNKTITERLEAAAYLIKAAYGLLGKSWPKMDKTYFRARKFEDG